MQPQEPSYAVKATVWSSLWQVLMLESCGCSHHLLRHFSKPAMLKQEARWHHLCDNGFCMTVSDTSPRSLSQLLPSLQLRQSTQWEGSMLYSAGMSQKSLLKSVIRLQQL